MSLRSLIVSTALLGAICAADAASAQALPPIHVPVDGPSLTFDFPAVRVGVAEYDDGPTGATVLLFGKPVAAAVDVRGGAPGTVNTDALRLAYDEPIVAAITLAGGSAYGLSVATGVANALKERTVDPGNWKYIAVVPGLPCWTPALDGAEIRRAGGGLEVEVAGRDSLYLPAHHWVSLSPVGTDEFELATPRADRVHLDRDARGRLVGLTIDPGPWPIRARRLPAR